MATNAVPVSAEQKDEEGVQAVEVDIPGVGPTTTYFKVITTDDVDEKTTKGVETYTFSIPQEIEEEVTVLDAEGDPILNEDGSAKLEVKKSWRTEAFEVDLSPASRSKLVKALEPFVKNARKKVFVPAQPAAKPTQPGSKHDSATIRKWAQDNNVQVDGKPINPMGRVPQAFVDLYEKANA